MIQNTSECQPLLDKKKATLDLNCVNSNFTNKMGETFGQWLSRNRKNARLNQTELAQRSRVTKSTISLYEFDRIAQPRPEVVERIAKALNVSIDEAREAAGYTPRSASAPIEIGIGATVKLADKDLTPEEQEEIAEELALAYELIMARRKARKAKTE